MKSPHLFGKYLLLERVSVGGMAEIFIAKAFGVEGFERILAIKKILPTMAEDEEFITMFIDEARICSALNHANIVHIHELGRHDGAYFIAMEYVAGLDLKLISEVFRRERQPFPVAQAVFLASKMCEALDYAHRAKDGRGQPLNIVHRDISPQNILVSFEGEVKLIDFGIAKAANRRQETQVGILKGKFGYMSPEQALGKPIDRRSDLFAVGVILYEMLTGDRLFVGESDFSVIDKVRNVKIAAPRELNPEIPKGLEKVLLKALAKEVDERYQWCSELQEDLTRFLVTDGQVYTPKQLSAFMKEVFAEDLAREAERMERFASVERPDELEDSSVEESPRRRTSKQVPIAAPPTSRVPPQIAPVAPAAPPPKRDSGGFRAARPGPPAPEPVPTRTAIPFSAVPTSSQTQAPVLSRQPTAPAELPSVVVEGVDRTQVFDAMSYQESLAGAPPVETDPQGLPKAQVIIGEKIVSGPTVIGSMPVRAPPLKLEPTGPTGPTVVVADGQAFGPEPSDETPLQGKLLEDTQATLAMPEPPEAREPEGESTASRPRIEAAPTQAPLLGPDDEASFEPTRLRASGEQPDTAPSDLAEETSPGARASPANEPDKQPPGGEADVEGRPAEGEGAADAPEAAGVEQITGSEPTRISEGVAPSEQGARELLRLTGGTDPEGQSGSDDELQDGTDPVSRHALGSGMEETPTPSRVPGFGFDEDDIPERPTDTRSGETHVGPAPQFPDDEPSEEHTDPDASNPPVLHAAPPAGAGKPATRATSKSQLPARRPTGSHRVPPAARKANPRTRWVIIGASAVGLVAAVGLLAFALSGDSEKSALLVIADPRESAKIAVDGMAFPNGQVVMPFPEGEHELVVSAGGYKTASQRIRVEGRSTFQVRLVREPPPPAPPPVVPSESSAPPDAAPPPRSSPDGGTEPDKAAEPIPPTGGEHAGSPGEGGATEKRKPRTERSADVKAAASAKKKTGTLACTSNPLGADVIVDGRPTGRRTPVPFGTAIELPVGKHRLTLKAGSKSYTATIEIREGEVATVRNAILR